MSVTGGSARLRLLHTSPDAPAVDTYIDGTLVAGSVAFGQVTDYAALAPGAHTLRALPVGAGSQATALLDAGLEDLEARQDYTVIVLGRLDDLHAILLHDSTPAPAAGRAKIRAVQASPDAPPIDVGVAGGPAMLENVAFGQATPFREVDSGVVDLEVRLGGPEETVIELPDYTLADGSLYTFVALGLLDGQPAFMIMPLVQAVEMQLPV